MSQRCQAHNSMMQILSPAPRVDDDWKPMYEVHCQSIVPSSLNIPIILRPHLPHLQEEMQEAQDGNLQKKILRGERGNNCLEIENSGYYWTNMI